MIEWTKEQIELFETIVKIRAEEMAKNMNPFTKEELEEIKSSVHWKISAGVENSLDKPLIGKIESMIDDLDFIDQEIDRSINFPIEHLLEDCKKWKEEKEVISQSDLAW